MSRRRASILVAGGVAAVLAAAGVLWSLRAGPWRAGAGGGTLDEAGDLSLEAADSGPAGVAPTSAFVLNSRDPQSLRAVRQGLTVTPETALRVEKDDRAGRRFRVVPLAALAPDQVYRFRLALPGRSVRQWAFQTRAPFRVLGSLPGDRGQGVPVNTGIEIHFSHAGFADPGSHWEITPAVPGRFERSGRTLVFLPARPLAPGTVYTVRLRQGLPLTGTGEVLKEDFTFSFETAGPAAPPGQDFGLVGDVFEFPAAETPFFQLWWNGRNPGSVAVTLYRYPDAAAYIEALRRLEAVPAWASVSRSRYREGAGGLAEVARFDLDVRRQLEWYPAQAVFPERLPPGYYRADLQAGEVVRQARFQVTDLALYAAVTTTDTLVWVNDEATGGPVAGARVEVAGGGSAGGAAGGGAAHRTDAAGVAVLPTPAGYVAAPEQPLFLRVSAAGKEAVAYLPGRSWYRPEGPERERGLDYWKYFYLDRGLYKPGDTVNFWGIVAPRERGARPLPEVTVSLVDEVQDPGGGGRSVLAAATAPVERGTFTGSLKLPRLKPGGYHLEVRSGGVVLVDRWFSVETYTKPAYTVEASPARRAVFAGEDTAFTLRARFFEGTPVKGLTLNYSAGGRQGRVTTDDAGEAVIPFRPEYREGSYPGRTESLYAYNTLPEAGEISAQGFIRVFDSRLAVRGEGSVSAGRGRVTAQVHRVDLGRLNAGTEAAWDDFLGAPAAGQAVKATVVEERWEKVPEGQYYDFIHKVVRERYRYEYRPVTLEAVTLTADGEGRVAHDFAVERGKSYRVEFEAIDARGHAARDTVYVTGSDYAGREDVYRYYHLTPADPEKPGYAVGEPARVTLQVNDAPVPGRPQGFLFYTARRGLLGYRVQDTATYAAALREADLPQIHAAAVHFDGRQYRPASPLPVRFDAAARRLQVTVTPDRDAYRPRETVRLDVRVTDARGRPAAGAAVNLNLVDEALFALQDQIVNLPADLYAEWIPDGILATRHTHQVPDPPGGAESGGEGDGVRGDFRDAIFFATVVTGRDGRARAEFRVPDDLTSWRVTYQAVNERLEAGSGTARIPVKLPFFIDAVTSEAYLAGDRPVLPLRSHGEALRAGQPVAFTVEVTAPGGAVTRREVSGPAFATVWAPLPALEAGEYRVKVSGRAAGGLGDAVERTFRVEPSFLRRPQVRRAPLTAATRPAGAPDGVTVLEFTDARRGTVLSLLRDLEWRSGSRVEFRLAPRLAADLLQAHFGGPAGDGEAAGAETPSPAPDVAPSVPAAPPADLLEYQAENGGVAILPYADPDLEVSALLADACPGCLDRVKLARYFRAVLDGKDPGPERAALALYGLAALEQPVLLDVQAALGDTGLEPRVRVVLGLAAAELGDLERARAVLADLARRHGERTGEVLRLGVSRDRDEVIAATALAAALAAKVDAAEAVPLLQYLLDNPPEKRLVVLEELLAAQALLPRLAAEKAEFTYVLGGETRRADLSSGETLRLAVTPEQLKGLRFQSVRGRVTVVSRFDAPFAPPGGGPGAAPGGGSAGEASLAREYSVGRPPRHLLGGGRPGPGAPPVPRQRHRRRRRLRDRRLPAGGPEGRHPPVVPRPLRPEPGLPRGGERAARHLRRLEAGGGDRLLRPGGERGQLHR